LINVAKRIGVDLHLLGVIFNREISLTQVDEAGSLFA